MMRQGFLLLVGCGAMLALATGVLAITFGDKPAENAAGTGYRQLAQWAIGGEGGWDYLACDSEAQRLYIARETRVQVVDLAKGRVVGEVANTPGVHGIALAPKLHRGFTSNGRENSVMIFNLKDMKEIQRVPVGTRPDAIVYDPATKQVFTMNAGSNDLTAINAAKGKIVGTLPLGGRPEFVAVDEHGKLFVNLTDTNEMVVIETAKLAILHRWPLAPGEHPTGLAIDAAHHRLFSVCANAKMIVMDAVNGRIVEALPIGNGADAAAFDPETGFAFSSNGRDGTLTVSREDAPDTINVTDTVLTQKGARTMAVDRKTHNVYLVTAHMTAPPEGTNQRPTFEPGSFVVLVFGNPPSRSQARPDNAPNGSGGHGGTGHHHGGWGRF